MVLVKRVQAGEGVGYGHTFRAETPTDVALVPIGYGDGVFRALGNRGHVLINGRRYPLVGRISMDSFGVDVGTDGRVQVGDTVTLIGADGDERITVEEIARRVGTINYEITCDIALDRSERLFLNDVEPSSTARPRACGAAGQHPADAGRRRHARREPHLRQTSCVRSAARACRPGRPAPLLVAASRGGSLRRPGSRRSGGVVVRLRGGAGRGRGRRRGAVSAPRTRSAGAADRRVAAPPYGRIRRAGTSCRT